VCGHALEHGRGSLLFSDAIRNFHQTIGRDSGVFSVAALDAAVSHAVADFE